jgi:hypothetical protein
MQIIQLAFYLIHENHYECFHRFFLNVHFVSDNTWLTGSQLQTGGKDKGGDKKKKKGEPEQELKKNPPTYTTLATWHVSLADFLEGEFQYQSVFSQGGVEVASTVRSMDTDSARKVFVFFCFLFVVVLFKIAFFLFVFLYELKLIIVWLWNYNFTN